MQTLPQWRWVTKHTLDGGRPKPMRPSSSAAVLKPNASVLFSWETGDSGWLNESPPTHSDDPCANSRHRRLSG
jgi:hypothetical protein